MHLQVDVTDAEVLELVEMEIRDLLSEMGFDGDGTSVVKGSALAAMEGKTPEIGNTWVGRWWMGVTSK